jgi:alpha-L-fucosidase
MRFVTKGKTLYATLPGWPTDKISIIKTLKADTLGKVETVSLLGGAQTLNFEQPYVGLKVNLPAHAPAHIMHW